MPQATDELRAAWGGENGVGPEKACSFLAKQGYVQTAHWQWRCPPDHIPTQDELDAAQFLIDEWDYGGIIYITFFQELRNGPNKPRYHGNGFTQIYLNERIRLHVWHPTLKPFANHNASIHNHRYDAFSRVLRGKLQHTVFDTQPNLSSRVGGDVYGKWTIKNGGTEMQHNGDVIVTEIGTHIMAAGSTYTFNQPYFHTSEAAELTVTLFGIGQHEFDAPETLSPLGEHPDNAFDDSKMPSLEAMWMAIYHGIEGLNMDIELQRSVSQVHYWMEKNDARKRRT